MNRYFIMVRGISSGLHINGCNGTLEAESGTPTSLTVVVEVKDVTDRRELKNLIPIGMKNSVPVRLDQSKDDQIEAVAWFDPAGYAIYSRDESHLQQLASHTDFLQLLPANPDLE